ncbi:indolepyruvate oxidoreductase subunit beta [Thermogladius sp. 4427co]|uniref:indolepyruvate oxidoreductase subunit beta n=1 Tax=Thermogladius sp. 4427co TaxID=3450718 RepID=UPI003F7AB089
MKDAVNILISSVGGQGGLTLSRIIATAAVLDGYSVRTGETLGMAQRYGSVLSFIRVGREVYSPIFSKKQADYLLGLELVESLRALDYLRDVGLAIVADEYKPPISASIDTKLALDRTTVSKQLESVLGSRLVIVPARSLALKAGSYRALNVVLLGVFNAITRLFKHDSVIEAIKTVLPGRAGEISVRAYGEGLEFARSVRDASPI